MSDDTFHWLVADSPYASGLTEPCQSFAEPGDREPLWIVDQFNCKIPMLFNREFLATGKLDLQFCHSLVLDCNVVSRVDKFVRQEKPDMPVARLLRFLARRRNWDFNPAFYLLEHFAKTTVRRLARTLRCEYMRSSAFRPWIPNTSYKRARL